FRRGTRPAIRGRGGRDHEDDAAAPRAVRRPRRRLRRQEGTEPEPRAVHRQARVLQARGRRALRPGPRRRPRVRGHVRRPGRRRDVDPLHRRRGRWRHQRRGRGRGPVGARARRRLRYDGDPRGAPVRRGTVAGSLYWRGAVVYHRAAMRRLFALVLLWACVEKEPEKIDENFIRENTLSAAPTPRHPVNADLAGKVIYLGCDVDKEVIVSGTNLKIVHYWKVVQAPGSEWRAFTHVEGSVKEDWLNVDQTKLRSMYGADKWKAGDILRDEQVVPIGKTWKSPNATIYLGLYRKGAQGEAGRMAVVSGPTDGKNQVKVLTLPVSDVERKPGPDYVIRPATGKIVVAGKGRGPGGASARAPAPVKVAEGGGPVDGEATAKLLWDDKNLYVLVTVADKDVASQYTKHDDPIWKEDAVELFIDADKNGAGYVEL